MWTQHTIDVAKLQAITGMEAVKRGPRVLAETIPGVTWVGNHTQPMPVYLSASG